MENYKISLRNQIYEYVEKKYKSKIEYLWFKYPNYAVFRNNYNKKWYGIIMDIPYKKIGIDKEGYVDILNIKVGDLLLKELLIQQQGIYKAYHISRGNWISVSLDGMVDKEQIFALIDESYSIVSKSKKNGS